MPDLLLWTGWALTAFAAWFYRLESRHARGEAARLRAERDRLLTSRCGDCGGAGPCPGWPCRGSWGDTAGRAG